MLLYITMSLDLYTVENSHIYSENPYGSICICQDTDLKDYLKIRLYLYLAGHRLKRLPEDLKSASANGTEMYFATLTPSLFLFYDCSNRHPYTKLHSCSKI